MLGGTVISRSRPAVMAIINLTTDSFYGPARYSTALEAVAAAEQALADGATIIDLGAVRAGEEGEWVTAAQEIDRLRPVVDLLRGQRPDLIISVDTWRSEVVGALADLRIDLVNDTWAGHDPYVVHAAAEVGAGIVCSHTGGLPPRTDPRGVSYPPEPDGIVSSVVAELMAGANRALGAGIPPSRILLDPTLDFGKTTNHSLSLLRNTATVVDLGYPTMQAISRKDFVGETLDRTVDDRLPGSLAATAVAAWLGATVFRSHDVRPTRDVLDMVASIAGARAPSVSRRGL